MRGRDGRVDGGIFSLSPINVSRQCIHFKQLFLKVHFLKSKLLGQLDPLSESAHPRINGTALGLETLTFLPELRQRHDEDLDELVLLERRFGVLVLGEGHVDGEVDHA